VDFKDCMLTDVEIVFSSPMWQTVYAN